MLPDQPTQFIFGYGSLIKGGDIAKYDIREGGYRRVEAPRDDIEAISWQLLPAIGRIWVYIPAKADREPGVGLPGASAQFPLLKSYVDVVVEGALEYGETFAHELLETTSDWSDFWLSDRELARRPWVYNPASSQVDALLMETSAAAAKLEWRRFPETYSIHWAEEKAQ